NGGASPAKVFRPRSRSRLHSAWSWSFVERCVDQKIHSRHGLVTRHEALAEIAQKVVRARLRLGGHKTTTRLREFGLHLHTRGFPQNSGHGLRRDEIVEEP